LCFGRELFCFGKEYTIQAGVILQTLTTYIANINHEIKSNEQSLGITWLGTDFIVDYADFFLKETRNNLILFSKSDVKDKSFKLDLHSCGENRKVTGNFIT
jgi:hypothetical protein